MLSQSGSIREIRLECLKLAATNGRSIDKTVIDIAQEYYDFVIEQGSTTSHITGVEQ